MLSEPAALAAATPRQPIILLTTLTDATTSAGGDAAADTTGSAQAAGSQANTNTTPSGDDGGDERLSLAETQKLRREHQSLRARLKEREDYDAIRKERDDLKQASLSEDEKRQARIKELEDIAGRSKAEREAWERERATLQLDRDLTKAIVRLRNDPKEPLNFADADDVLALLPRDALTAGENGQPDLDAALRAFARRKPHLLLGGGSAPTPGAGAAATNPPRSQSSAGAGLPSFADFQKMSATQMMRFTTADLDKIMNSR